MLSLGKRDTTITLIGCVNAIGNSIPPALIFSRVHFKEHVLKGAHLGTLEMANIRGISSPFHEAF